VCASISETVPVYFAGGTKGNTLWIELQFAPRKVLVKTPRYHDTDTSVVMKMQRYLRTRRIPSLDELKACHSLDLANPAMVARRETFGFHDWTHPPKDILQSEF
jgi:hypothetical protein